MDVLPHFIYIYYILYVCISTSQVSLVDGIDSFKPFWVIQSSNSNSTGRASPVTRQQIDSSNLGGKIAHEFTTHTYIWCLYIESSNYESN